MKKKFATILGSSLFFVFCAIILAMSIRGVAGNPTGDQLNAPKWKEDGPLELSPDRGRFVLTESVIENKSFYFSVPLAKFATPDLGYKNGNYVSLFAPAVSFIVMPGYIIGKYFGISQVGTFAVIALFALINVWLIRKIALLLGASKTAAALAGLSFLFATPAFTYGVTLYQHHISAFLILLSIYTLLRWKNVWSLGIIWFLCATSIPVDNPDFFFMLPIGLYATSRFISVSSVRRKITINFRFWGILTFLTMIIPLGFFLWFNKMSYGNPFQLAGTVGGVSEIGLNGRPVVPKIIKVANADALLNPDKQQKNAISFFRTRNLINGFYEHFISQDRGMLFFTPVVFFGIIGMIFLYKKNKHMTVLLLSVICTNILLYSMWGDPYGGWAFGSRYLIPTYALLSIFISIALTRYKKSIPFLLCFFVVFIYSVTVNTIGALSSSANPPKVEVLALEKLSGKVQKYSYNRNFDYLSSDQSKSFLWQTYLAADITALQYLILLAGSIVEVSVILLIVLWTEERN